MSVDLATLGIKVDATDADGARVKLDQLTGAGERAETSVKGLSNAAAALGFTMKEGGTATNKAAAEADFLAAKMIKVMNSVAPYEAAQHAANAELAEARILFEAGYLSAEQFANAQTTLAARSEAFAAKQASANAMLAKGSTAARLQSYEMLNLSRQASDVGVQLAMGMNPLMILVQQGPQIADVLGNARARGVSLGAAFAQMGASVLPFLPIIIGVGTVAATAFAAAGLALHVLNKDLDTSAKGIRSEFGLTEKQMDRLKDKGTELGYTFGDVFAGIKTAVVGALTDAFGPTIDKIKAWWDKFLDDTATGAIAAVKDIGGSFTGAFYAIKAVWSLLPAAIGDLAIQAANFTISAIESMVNKAGDLINGMIDKANEGAEAVGLSGRLARVGTLSLGRIDNPYAGAASNVASKAQSAYNEGYDSFGAGVDKFGDRFRKGAGQHREDRIREDAGDGDKAKKGKKAPKPKESQEEKDYKQAVTGAENYIKALSAETDAIGKNRIETKRLATERAQAEINAAALAVGTQAAMAKAAELTGKMADEQKRWEDAVRSDALKNLRRDLTDQADAVAFETSMIGLNNEARARAMAQREIDLKLRAMERDGIHLSAQEIEAETAKILEQAGAKGRLTDASEAANRAATAMRDMADAVRESTESFGELFGTAGEGFANLLNVMLDFDAQQADSRAKLIELQEEYNNGQKSEADYTFERGRIQDDMARRQVGHYGDMIHAAKGFFKEGSTGWKILEGAERAYRIFQFAMQIRAMFMDSAHTASSVANSGARAAADGIAAVAKAIASLPFPLNIVAGAATLAFLVGIGVKMFGGKGGGHGGASASSSAEDKRDIYNGPRDEFGAPTSSYSVLRPGSTVAADRGGQAGYGGASVGSSFKGGDLTVIVQGNMVEDTMTEIMPVLQSFRQQTVQDARQAVAADNAAAQGRQYIGGSWG